MKKISELFGQNLQWIQPGLTDPYFELRLNEEPMASLKFRNSFGSYAEGSFGGNTWSFKRQGFLNTYVTIREKGKEENIAVYHNHTWSEGGTLELPDGTAFTANSNYWQEQFEFTDSSERPIMKFTHIRGIKLHAQVEIAPGCPEIDNYPWLVVLGWYLTVMASREGEMVAALF